MSNYTFNPETWPIVLSWLDAEPDDLSAALKHQALLRIKALEAVEDAALRLVAANSVAAQNATGCFARGDFVLNGIMGSKLDP